MLDRGILIDMYHSSCQVPLFCNDFQVIIIWQLRFILHNPLLVLMFELAIIEEQELSSFNELTHRWSMMETSK